MARVQNGEEILPKVSIPLNLRTITITRMLSSGWEGVAIAKTRT